MHPSKILVLYLTAFLLFIAFFTVNPFHTQSLTYFMLPILIVILLFWPLRAVRYFSILCFVVIVAHTRVNQAQVSEFRGYYEADVVVVQEPVIKGKNQKFKVKNSKGDFLMVTSNQFPTYKFGDQLHLAGEVKEGSSGDYGKKYLLSGELFYPKLGPSRTSILKGSSLIYFKVRNLLIDLKNNYEYKISSLLPEPEAGLLAGIMLGSKADLSADFLSALSRTGTMHIIALSGFNITILAEFVRLLTKRLSKRSSTIIPLVTVWAFVLATGLSASVIRAAIMGSLIILGRSIGRRSDSLVAVLLASSVMVFASPNILLYDIGFQLSFAATVGILFLAPRIERYFYAFGTYFGPILATTLAAQLLTWPITSYYFGNVSLIAPLVNFFILLFVHM